MATLTALKFPTADGAKNMLDTVKQLQRDHLISLLDAAMVTWPQGQSKPKTKQLFSLRGIGTMEGAFWGTLFGVIFFVPLFGLALGAVAGGLAHHFTQLGISDAFIKQVREQVTEGTSALFLLTQKAVMSEVLERVKGHQFELIATNLSPEEETMLREAFAADEVIWLDEA